MRSLLIVCVVACVALVAGTANAAGQISDNTLAQMGLAGLQTMSDAQGSEIRGMGFAAVVGTNTARLNGSTVATAIIAVSARPNALAVGASAGVIVDISHHHITGGMVAVGGALAFGK